MSSAAAQDRLGSVAADRDVLLKQMEGLKARFVDAAARRCLGNGWTRVALWGDGAAVRTMCRQPWQVLGMEVVGVVAPDGGAVPGLAAPVVTPSRAVEGGAEAVVICSDRDESVEAERAARAFERWSVPVVRIYGDRPEYLPWGAGELAGRSGLSERDASWLVANRSERHDASLPMLPSSRTELHLRRYELALPHAEGRRVLDAACGTGYGSELLGRYGSARSVVGVDIEARSVDYASRRHSAPGVTFRVADATRTSLGDGAVDLVVSYETVEHVADSAGLIDEFARVLTPGGLMLMSTPNDWGPTEHHVHSFDRDGFVSLLERRFEVVELYGQRAGDEPRVGGLPAGIWPLTPAAPEPELFVALSRVAG